MKDYKFYHNDLNAIMIITALSFEEAESNLFSIVVFNKEWEYVEADDDEE